MACAVALCEECVSGYVCAICVCYACRLEGPATPKAHRGEGAGTLSSPLKPVDPALAAKHSTSKPLGLPAWGPKPSAPKPNTTSNPATQPPAPTQTPTDPQATNTQPLSSTVPPFAAPPIHAPKPGSAPTQQGPQFGTGTPPWPSGLASSWTKSSQPGSATQERFEFKAEPAEGGGSLGSASHRAAASSMRRSASRNSVGSATRSAHGSPMAQPGSRVGLDGRAGSPVAPAARPAVRLSNPAQPGNCPVANSQDVLASVSTLTGSEVGIDAYTPGFIHTVRVLSCTCSLALCGASVVSREAHGLREHLTGSCAKSYVLRGSRPGPHP